MKPTLLLAVLTCMISSHALAIQPPPTVDYAFTGTVNNAAGTFFGITPHVGDPVTGHIRFDLSLADDWPSDPNFARYQQLPPSIFEVVLNGVHISSDGKFFTYIQNDVGGGDLFQVSDGEAVNEAGTTLLVNGISQTGTLDYHVQFFQTIWPNDSLPPFIDLSQAISQQGGVGDAVATGHGAGFIFNTFVLVPEPGIGSAIFAASVLFAKRRSRKNSY